MERIKTQVCTLNDIFFPSCIFAIFPPWPRSQLKGRGIAICDTLSFQSTSFSFIWYSLDIWFSSYLSFLSIIFHMQWQRERERERERDKFDRKELFFCFSNTSSFSRPNRGKTFLFCFVFNWSGMKPQRSPIKGVSQTPSHISMGD